MFLRIIKHLLPRAKAWTITTNKTLRELIVGLTGFPVFVKEFIDLVWFDIFPQTTRELPAWEQQFGLLAGSLTDQQRRDRLDLAWKRNGGQDPTFLQETLQAAGFDVYVHEWWVPASDPPVARNPLTYLTGGSPTAYPLWNNVFVAQQDFITVCGEADAECGEPVAECGNYTGFSFKVQEPIISTDPDTFPFYVYIGGETFPNTANVDADRQSEFETLCLKHFPRQQWLAMLIVYV